MAAGDIVSDLQSIATGSYLTIQPGAGAEWIIHNIYFDHAVEVFFYDGTNNLLFERYIDHGIFPWQTFKLTNSRYLRVKAQASTTLIGYDGVVIK